MGHAILSLFSLIQAGAGTLPAATQPSARFEHRELPDGVAAEVGGEPVSEGEFGRWLARYRGDALFGEFLAGRLLRREAAAEGIGVSPEEVEKRFEEEVAERVKGAFLGDREKWIREEIVGQGRSLASFRRERGERLETELLVEKILSKRRVVTDADVRAAWEERSGKGGRKLSFRHILFEILVPSGPPAAAAETERRRRELDEQVRNRCALARAQILGGMDFAQAARAFSNDEATKNKGGTVGPTTSGTFGPLFEEEVWNLKKGVLSDPIRSNRGWHLVEVTDETVTPFESVAEGLRNELKTRRPFATESRAFLTGLLANARVVR